MSPALERFAETYGTLFERYLRERGEAELQAAYELGREAVARELSVLDLAAVHHDALRGAVRGADADAVDKVLQSASQFFLDLLSAFEIAQKALHEAREQAVLERKQAVVVRRLSSFLADASLAVDSADSVDEALQLVAEHAREIVDAECCVVRLATGSDAVSHSHDERACAYRQEHIDLARVYDSITPDGTPVRFSAEERRRHPAWTPLPLRGAPEVRAWLAVALTRLDGRRLGLIHLFARSGATFSEVDEAVIVQLAQMASAALERSESYRARV